MKYEVICHVINFDEIHLTKSSEGDNGGPHSNTLTNPNLLWAGTWVFRDPGGHVTGLFGSNCPEALPLIIVYKTRSTNADNMRMKPKWVEGLTEVIGKWGLGDATCMDTHVHVCQKGRMDKTLFIETVLFYKLCFHCFQLHVYNIIFITVSLSKYCTKVQMGWQ